MILKHKLLAGGESYGEEMDWIFSPAGKNIYSLDPIGSAYAKAGIGV